MLYSHGMRANSSNQPDEELKWKHWAEYRTVAENPNRWDGWTYPSRHPSTPLQRDV